MIYDTSFSPKIEPFMIVSSPYISLDGSIKTYKDGTIQRALFLILFTEDTGHAIACKITSQQEYLNEFTYIIRCSTHPFLRADSYVQFDRWHTLYTSKCAIVGRVADSVRMALLRKFDLITRSIDSNLKDHMNWNYLRGRNFNYKSPNIKEE